MVVCAWEKEQSKLLKSHERDVIRVLLYTATAARNFSWKRKAGLYLQLTATRTN